jgi:hypothetical protein
MQRYLLLLILVCSCERSVNQETSANTKTLAIEVEVRESGYGGFGYDIRVNDKLVVHQPNVPALPGNNGFPTRKSAEQVAALVVQKIRNSEMPPSVTTDEVIAAMDY